MVRSTLLLALLSLATGCCGIDLCGGGIHCRSPFCGTTFGFTGCNRCGGRGACRSGCNPCGNGCAPANWGGVGYGDPSLVAPSYGPPAATIPGSTYTTMPAAPANTPIYTLPAVDATGTSNSGPTSLVPPPQALPTGVSPAPLPTTQAPSVIRNTYSWGRGHQRS